MQVGGKDVKVLTCGSCEKSCKRSSRMDARDSSMFCSYLPIKNICKDVTLSKYGPVVIFCRWEDLRQVRERFARVLALSIGA